MWDIVERSLELVIRSQPQKWAASQAIHRSIRIKLRSHALKAAAEFVGLWGQTREDIKSEHVLVLANRWLEWVERRDP